ncbi:MAG: transcriptional regulator, PadR-like family [Patescibacteria group bacterium]|nr:transcriptional regulator, PadR-like family [Patescibacteria group bacterium]
MMRDHMPGGPQARRGDMRPLVLNMLTEKPMHGYEIIRALEEKSHGFWRPSPGSIYPTLQLLEEEDFVTSQEEQGKKIYTLTPVGREEAARKAPACYWDAPEMEEHIQARRDFMEFMKLLKQVAGTGSEADRRRVHEILKETKTKLEAIINEQ